MPCPLERSVKVEVKRDCVIHSYRLFPRLPAAEYKEQLRHLWYQL